jgi:hypothetical protein
MTVAMRSGLAEPAIKRQADNLEFTWPADHNWPQDQDWPALSHHPEWSPPRPSPLCPPTGKRFAALPHTEVDP